MPGSARHAARTFTTDSWDLPSPNIAVPPFLRKDWQQLQLFVAKENALVASGSIPYFGLGGNDSVMELVIVRIIHEQILKPYRNTLKTTFPTATDAQIEQQLATALTPGGTGSDPSLQSQLLAALDTNPASTSSAVAQARSLLSPELASTLRMNINRTVGDGRDDDGNNAVDEPSTSTTGETALEVAGNVQGAWKTVFGNVVQNLTNGRNTNQLLARQLLAKDLYILARLVIDDDYFLDSQTGKSHVDWFTEPTLSPTGTNETGRERARDPPDRPMGH